jgi:hypothetical protein
VQFGPRSSRGRHSDFNPASISRASASAGGLYQALVGGHQASRDAKDQTAVFRRLRTHPQVQRFVRLRGHVPAQLHQHAVGHPQHLGRRGAKRPFFFLHSIAPVLVANGEQLPCDTGLQARWFKG